MVWQEALQVRHALQGVRPPAEARSCGGGSRGRDADRSEQFPTRAERPESHAERSEASQERALASDSHEPRSGESLRFARSNVRAKIVIVPSGEEPERGHHARPAPQRPCDGDAQAIVERRQSSDRQSGSCAIRSDSSVTRRDIAQIVPGARSRDRRQPRQQRVGQRIRIHDVDAGTREIPDEADAVPDHDPASSRREARGRPRHSGGRAAGGPGGS